MAFVGMLNGTATDRSAAFSLEQAIIPGLVRDASRTWGVAWYNVVLDAAGSLGALAAALPLLLQRWLALPLLAFYRMVFLGCAFLGVIGAILYSSVSAGVEVTKSESDALPRHITPATNKVVTKLAGLFSLDAFGGGFLTDALVAYWFFRRFGVAEESLGVLCFAVHLLNAASHLGAAWLARRIGLVNTMVFTADLCQRYRESSTQCLLGRRFVGSRLSDAERGLFGASGARRRGQDRLRLALVSCVSKP